jgi:dGTPase
MLSEQVYDVIDNTRALIKTSGVQSLSDVRSNPGLVAFSPAMRERSQMLKTFLLHNLYRHPQVVETTDRARRVVTDLFELYIQSPQELPQAHGGSLHHARAVADYIAGMTDRFAIREHQRLCAGALFP